jgi:hypothetical protein
MKKIILLIFLFFGITCFAQQIFVEAGKTSSNFYYKNSQREVLQNLQPTTKNYVSVGYKRKFFAEKLNLILGVTHNSYGAIGSDPDFNTFFEWDVDYLGVNVGLDYTVFALEEFSFFIKATASYEFLIQGTQTINNQTYNLIAVEEFDNNGIFFRSGGGFSYPLTNSSNIYLQYLYGESIGLKDESPSSNEELKIKMHMVGIGFTINLPPKKEKEVSNQVDIIE